MKQFKKAISVLVTLCLVISLMSVTAFAAEYDDTEGHWAETYIDKWSDYGVVQGMGDGTFQPNGPVTRAQAAQVFANLLGLTATVSNISAIFRDVPADAWFADAIAKCYAAGIMLGNGDGTMTPNELLTREQFFTMFARAIAITQGTPSAEAKEDMAEKGYKDAADVSDYAADSVKSLIDLGWVNGITLDTLAPQDTINRASVMKVLGTAISTYVGPNQDVTEVKAEGDGITLIANPNVESVSGKADVVVVAAGAKDIELQVAEGAEIQQLNVSADGAVIAGEGEVAKVVASTLDVTVTTANTEYEKSVAEANEDGSTTTTTVVGKNDEAGATTGETKTETTVKETTDAAGAKTTEKDSTLTKTDAAGTVTETTATTSSVKEATDAEGNKTTTTASTTTTTDADGKATTTKTEATVKQTTDADGNEVKSTEATVTKTDADGKETKTTTAAKVTEAIAEDGSKTTTTETTKSTTDADGKTATMTTTATVSEKANEDGSTTKTTETKTTVTDDKGKETSVVTTETATAATAEDGTVTTTTETKTTVTDSQGKSSTETTVATAVATENADGSVTTETTTVTTDASGKKTTTTDTATVAAEVNEVIESAGTDITSEVVVPEVADTGSGSSSGGSTYFPPATYDYKFELTSANNNVYSVTALKGITQSQLSFDACMISVQFGTGEPTLYNVTKDTAAHKIKGAPASAKGNWDDWNNYVDKDPNNSDNVDFHIAAGVANAFLIDDGSGTPKQITDPEIVGDETNWKIRIELAQNDTIDFFDYLLTADKAFAMTVSIDGQAKADFDTLYNFSEALKGSGDKTSAILAFLNGINGKTILVNIT